MRFSGKLHPLDLNTDKIPHLLNRVREIYDLPKAPDGAEGCEDCDLLNNLLAITIRNNNR